VLKFTDAPDVEICVGRDMYVVGSIATVVITLWPVSLPVT
jgi:hypothetical protein